MGFGTFRAASDEAEGNSSAAANSFCSSIGRQCLGGVGLPWKHEEESSVNYLFWSNQSAQC